MYKFNNRTTITRISDGDTWVSEYGRYVGICYKNYKRKKTVPTPIISQLAEQLWLPNEYQKQQKLYGGTQTVMVES